jgi:hypothetical protein
MRGETMVKRCGLEARRGVKCNMSTRAEETRLGTKPFERAVRLH